MAAVVGSGKEEGRGGRRSGGRPCDHFGLDVPVTTQQLIDRVVDFPVMRQRRTHSARCAENRRNSTGAVLGAGLDSPLLCIDRCVALRPCDHAATSSSGVTVGGLNFSSSTECVLLRCATDRYRGANWCSRTAATGTPTRPSMCQ